jgi:hypothetical protein
MELKNIQKITINGAKAIASFKARVPSSQYTIVSETAASLRVSMTIYSDIAYKDLVVYYIREKYSVNDEIALIRQVYDKGTEFQAYTDYAEECKAKARAFVEERNAFLGLPAGTGL